MPRTSLWRRGASAAGLVALLVLVGCSSTTSRKGNERGKDDKEFRERVEKLVRAYESRQVERIAPFYAPDALSLSFHVPFKYDTGSSDSQSTVRRVLDQLADLKVDPLEPNEVWKYKNRVWTLRPFRMECTVKDGTKLVWAGRHSAIWEKQKDVWVIVNEHFLDEPEVTRPAPAAPKPPPPVAAAVPEPPKAPVRTGRLEDVFFDLNRWEIRPDQIERLEADAAFLRDVPSITLLIEGHCDERGGEAYNDQLGARRAESTKTFLVEHGVDSSRITTASVGKRRPFETGKGEPVWQQNRRAHFVVRENQQGPR
jgi:peptidoglycan-associated lipoprotein